MFDELPTPTGGPTPWPVRALRAFGATAMALIVLAAITGEPPPGTEGDGLWITVGIAALVVGLAITIVPRRLPGGLRPLGLLLVAVASWVLTYYQPDGAAIGGVYVVVVIAALRLPVPVSLPIAALAVAGELVAVSTAEHPAGARIGLITSIIPWYLVIRLLRQVIISRAASADAAAEAERGRMARELHDVLAHSLSGLALQLEGARLLARDRGADPEVVGAIERAHGLAASGLGEARQAIAALRGETLPGPERLRDLADAFAADSRLACDVTTTGTPHELGSEARLALYRTAQEALTNIRRHSTADQVEIALAYEPDGTRLLVADHGPGAPVAVGAGEATPGSGYGLAGMRERAELLGGRLEAGPTGDGFRVELWLPA